MILPSIDSIFGKPNNTVSTKPIKAVEKKPIQPTSVPTATTNNVSLPPIIETSKTASNTETKKQEAIVQKTTDSDTPLPSLVEQNENVKEKAPISEERKQVLYLKRLDLQQFLNEKHKITDLAENEEIAPAIRAEALNLLLKYSPTIRIKTLGEKALAENDSRLQAVGFKMLERVAPDILKSKLSDLLLSSDTNIRVRAIRFGLKVDSKKSINALEKLISSEDQNHRSYAVSCLALCPFESVYIILIKALREEKHPLVAKQITAIILRSAASAARSPSVLKIKTQVLK